MVGLGKIFGRSVKNFGRPGQFLKVWKKIRNVRGKLSEKMYGKKSRGSKILATRGRGDFVKFYLAPPPKCLLPLKCPPPPKFRDLAPPLHHRHLHFTHQAITNCLLPKSLRFKAPGQHLPNASWKEQANIV